MASFIRQRFEVDKSDTNKINAIAKFNKTSFIQTVNGRTMKKRATCADLPELIKEYPGDDIVFECQNIRAHTLIDIFPAVNKAELAAEIGDTKVPTVAQDIVSYFASIMKQNETGYEMFYCPPTIKELTKNEALAILHSFVDNGRTLNGALHLPTENMIILQKGSSTFKLKYGENPELSELTGWALDVDDGFDSRDTDNPIPVTLHLVFAAWKGNNYAGDLFNYLPNLKQQNTAAEEKPSANTATVSSLGQFARTTSTTDETPNINNPKMSLGSK